MSFTLCHSWQWHIRQNIYNKQTTLTRLHLRHVLILSNENQYTYTTDIHSESSKHYIQVSSNGNWTNPLAVKSTVNGHHSQKWEASFQDDVKFFKILSMEIALIQLHRLTGRKTPIYLLRSGNVQLHRLTGRKTPIYLIRNGNVHMLAYSARRLPVFNLKKLALNSKQYCNRNALDFGQLPRLYQWYSLR